MNKTITFLAKDLGKKIRLDKYLADNLNDFTRSQIKKIILSKNIKLNKKLINSASEKVKNDIFNSQHLFDYYVKKNPNGKIIFVSSAGDMHQNHGGMFCSGMEQPNPRSLYGKSKLHVEQVLDTLDCKTVVLRTSNIWGGEVDGARVNGLVDKMFNALNTDKVIEIYANLDTYVDLINVDDFIDLLIKVIDTDLDRDHEMFLVGGQSISIGDIINKISKRGLLNLKIDQKGERSFINVQPFKAEHTFDWKRKVFL